VLLRPGFYAGSSGSAGRRATLILAAALSLAAPSSSRAQAMEPLTYTNAPIGLNFLIAGYGYLWGDVLVWTSGASPGRSRWSCPTEFGVSKALGRWTLEAAAGVTFYTDNDEFLGTNVRRQKPLYSVQGHVLYNFSPALWAALDATYYTGGSTSVNGTLNDGKTARASLPLEQHAAGRRYLPAGVAGFGRTCST
jgi:hypothetical protein